jgi:hypothetical protein
VAAPGNPTLFNWTRQPADLRDQLRIVVSSLNPDWVDIEALLSTFQR